MNLHYNFALTLDKQCVGYLGDCEAASIGVVESTLKYQPLFIWRLIPNGRQCMVGSLTGVVASKSVTEAFKGTLSMLGNHA